MVEMRKTLCSSIYDGATEVCRVKYLIIDKSFIDNYPEYDFLVDDMAHVITDGRVDRIIYITEIFVHNDYRRSYYGSELLHVLAEQYVDSVLILRAGAVVSEYPEEPSDEEIQVIIDSLIYFFNRNGFVSINAYCGFENSEAMMYIGNDVGRDAYYDLLTGGFMTGKSVIYIKHNNPSATKYTWKDIVSINGDIYAEEFPISGKMDGDHYQLDDFISAVAKKYNVDTDDVQTYMMDNIDFDARDLSFGAEDCGCYINGEAEWI